ncbi:MAG: glutamate synthase subunit beta [Bacteroidales bacterium]|nr:glutamate synthase subunit beta [Bacteroidales bacterium]
MGDPKGFLKIERKNAGNRPVEERIMDFGEVEQTLNYEDRKLQASRCMDCGIPFCHWGCPVHSSIPEWQDALYRGKIKEASEILHSTNDMPEFTGRVCPAPCEKSCVLSINTDAVTIRENEAAVVERAFIDGYVIPKPPAIRSGKKVAVVGSGPAGLSVAARLNSMGHTVVVLEKDDKIGGLLRYGIPDFKLNKKIIDRRIKVFEEEGIKFVCNRNIGVDVKGEDVLLEFDAVCLTIGAMQPRDLIVEGRELTGIHFAMDYLTQQNKRNNGQEFSMYERIYAENKNVVVIGGGDTGSDCVGTAIRQKAKKVTQIEILPQPPVNRTENNPWPHWPNTLKTSSSHEEGCERKWSLATKRFIGENGTLKQIEVVSVEWIKNSDGKLIMKEIENTNQIIETDLVLLSMGFVHPVHKGLIEELKIELDGRGNIKIDENFQTSNKKVFAAGDAAIGASLVVRAIFSGRQAAEKINTYLRT